MKSDDPTPLSPRIRRVSAPMGVARRSGEPITLRSDVLIPPKPQVDAWADQVADRIAKLDAYATRLGAGFGLASEPYRLAPEIGAVNRVSVESKLTPQQEEMALLISSALSALTESFVPIEQVTLEQRDGRWGLYFFRAPGAYGAPNMAALRPQMVPLKDAPLAVRERFLLHAEVFFRQYVERAEKRLAEVKSAVGAADEALALLGNLKLV